MRAVVEQDAKQIAVNAGKMDLHVQTCVNLYNVKILLWLFVKGYYLTVILFHCVSRFWRNKRLWLAVYYLKKTFDRKSLLVLVLQTVSNLKMSGIKISMPFNVFYQNLIMTNLLLTCMGSFLTPWSLPCYWIYVPRKYMASIKLLFQQYIDSYV